MITVTRLNGAAFAINEDLIERIEELPDTTLFLVDGTTHIVREPRTVVVDRAIEARAEIIALASRKLDEPDLPGPRLVAVPTDSTPRTPRSTT